MAVKIDRLDVDQMSRIRDSDIWRDYERRIREKYESMVRSCSNGELDEKAIRMAQGGVSALRFVLELPEAMHQEVVRRKTNAG